LLLAGLSLGLTSAAVGVGAANDVLPGGPTVRRALDLTGTDGTVPNLPASEIGAVTVERLHSTARARDVDLVIMRPPGTYAHPLPVCLMLHGRGGTARGFIDFGVPQLLAASIDDGTRPFAIAAVDCGDGYFVRHPKDDPLKMLTDEVPAWLAARDLDETTVAALGISMGCFGSLNLARAQKLRAVAAASPALFRRWADAKTRKAFADEREWQAYEPLRHTSEFRTVPLGVWCGTEDSFIDSARELINKTHPEIHATTRGEHAYGYWLRVLPAMLGFIGAHLDQSRD
jgi:hypothetical protein